MGAVDEHGHVDIDTGAVMMSVDLLNSLYSLIDTEEKVCRLCQRTGAAFVLCGLSVSTGVGFHPGAVLSRDARG